MTSPPPPGPMPPAANRLALPVRAQAAKAQVTLSRLLGIPVDPHIAELAKLARFK